jgi:hypothetical protein
MIVDDGYTMFVDNIAFRPVLKWRRTWLAGVMDRGDWGAVEHFLWKGRDLNEKQKEKIVTKAFAYADEQERVDEQNLREFLKLVKTEPLLAQRPCSVCKKYWFDEDVKKAVSRNGQPLLRPEHAKVACETAAGCKKGHHENPIALSERNRKALWHYNQFRVVGCPDLEDDIVRRNWNLIYDTVGRNDVARYCKASH